MSQICRKTQLHEKAANENDCGKAAMYTIEAFAYICEAKCHMKKMAKKCAGIACSEGKDNENGK